jgi:hypothetical protein
MPDSTLEVDESGLLFFFRLRRYLKEFMTERQMKK